MPATGDVFAYDAHVLFVWLAILEPARRLRLVVDSVERLRKDHPDPKMREELYADRKQLAAYVRTLMNDHGTGEAAIGDIADAVRAAEDGKPHT